MRVGAGLLMTEGVLPIYGFDHREETGRGHLLLPGGVRPGRRQAADHLPGVPGHRGGAGRRDARRRPGPARPGPAQGVRRGRRRLGGAGGPRRQADRRRGDRGAPLRRRRLGRDLPGAGGAEPGGRAVLEAGLRGLVGEDGGAPVHEDSRDGVRSPPVLGRDARRHAGGPGRDQPPHRAGDRRAVRAGLLVGGPRHDQLRHLHRHRERQGPGRAAGQGQAEALRPAPGRAGPGRHPRRRDPADLARLPR